MEKEKEEREREGKNKAEEKDSNKRKNKKVPLKISLVTLEILGHFLQIILSEKNLQHCLSSLSTATDFPEAPLSKVVNSLFYKDIQSAEKQVTQR